MRQWLVNPKYMCQKHLCGEYYEIYTFVGTINKGRSVTGYLSHLEVETLHPRREELAKEMRSRGYNPTKELSPLNHHAEKWIGKGFVDRDKSLCELLQRCPACKERKEKS